MPNTKNQFQAGHFLAKEGKAHLEPRTQLWEPGSRCPKLHSPQHLCAVAAGAWLWAASNAPLGAPHQLRPIPGLLQLGVSVNQDLWVFFSASFPDSSNTTANLVIGRLMLISRLDYRGINNDNISDTWLFSSSVPQGQP